MEAGERFVHDILLDLASISGEDDRYHVVMSIAGMKSVTLLGMYFCKEHYSRKARCLSGLSKGHGDDLGTIGWSLNRSLLGNRNLGGTSRT